MRRLGPWWALLWVGGCMPASVQTIVDELRVLSVRATPPILDLGQGTQIDATIYRPDDRPVEVLMWTCTPGPNGCFEAGVDPLVQPLSAWTTLSTPAGEDARHTVAAAPAAVAALQGVELPPAFVWSLACVQGVCPFFDEVRADPEAGGEAWQAVLDQLANPFELVRTLPLVDTAASFRTLEVAALPDDAPRPVNPVVTFVEGPLVVPSGGTLEMTFEVVADEAEEEVRAFPVATVGGFKDRNVGVEDGRVTVELVAGGADSEDQPPVEVGTVIDVFVSFEGKQGGSALWRGQVEVVAP